ncbi:MAG: hypothetical protein ACOYA9_09085 [Bilifractor sp.]|jgi:hypothetical protein
MKRKILAVLLSVGMTASIFCNTVAVSADDTTSVQQVTVASEQTTEGSDTEAEQTTTDTTDAVVEQTTTDTTDAEAEQTTTNTTDAEDEQTTTDATEADQTKTETTDTEVEQTTTETTDTEAEQTTNETTDTEAEQTTTETTDAEAEQISALSVSSNSADDTTVETEHKWGNPQWTWSDDYSSATLTLTCQYDSSHTKTVDATVTSRVIRPAFCFQDGKTTYTAKAEVDGSIWVDQKSDNAVKGSHKWGNPQWTWSDDYSSATLTLTCQYDSSHTKTVDATVTSRVIRPAFCFQDGKTTYTAKAEVDGSIWVDQKSDNAVKGSHKWGDPQWTWSDDYSSATLTLTCQYDSSHTKTVDATVTSRVIRPAFCFQDGKTTYLAKAEVDGSTWVDLKSDNAVKGSHKWGDPQWTWSDDYSSATLTLTCQYDSSHTKTVDATVTSRVIRPAFCFQDGKTTYLAKAEVDGSTWVDLKSDNAVKGSHKWGDPQWTWSDDYTSATVTRVCKYDSSHTETADAEITSEVTTAPTCTEDGVITYTATAVLDGEEITTQTTAAAEALGHAWTDPQWTWSDDYSKASVTLTCGNDETHTETLDAVVTKETTDSKNVYTASVQVDGVVLTDVKTVKIETSDTDKSEDTKDNDNNSSESETTDTKAEKEETSATAATTTKFNTTTSTAAATNTTTSTEAPETGDTANAAGWTVMIAGALLALVVLKKAKRYIK